MTTCVENVCDSKVENVIESLEQDATRLSAWYPENYMKLNVDKFHLIIFGEKNDKMKIQIGDAVVTESIEENTRSKARYKA